MWAAYLAHSRLTAAASSAVSASGEEGLGSFLPHGVSFGPATEPGPLDKTGRLPNELLESMFDFLDEDMTMSCASVARRYRLWSNSSAVQPKISWSAAKKRFHAAVPVFLERSRLRTGALAICCGPLSWKVIERVPQKGAGIVSRRFFRWGYMNHSRGGSSGVYCSASGCCGWLALV